jgi:hypothetical protein
MKTRRGSRIGFAFLLPAILCALFQGTAIAQQKTVPKIISPAEILSRSNKPVTEGTDSSKPSTLKSRESEDIELLKQQLALQQKHIEKLERMLDEQKRLLEQVLHVSADNPATAANAAARSAVLDPTATQPAPDAIEPTGGIDPPPLGPGKGEEEPASLSLKLGKVYLTPVGFLDFTAFVRDRNVGSGIGTNFGGIPFPNVPSGQLSEFRSTMQNSRLGVRLDTRFKGTDLLGYLETDFNGFSPGNVAVTTNSNGLRVRLFWLDVRKRKWELLAGQSWSLLTPNRQGLSPLPADVFSALNIDPNLQVGLTWSRNPQFRVVYHASRTVTLGVSFEAAEQYGGGSAGAGKITLPAQLASAFAAQLNTGDSTFNVPNLHPDIIAKIAFDPKLNGRALHFEFAGLLSTFKFFNPLDGRTHSAVGGGASAGLNYELFRNFRLIASGFYSDGGGRWIFGLGPDFIIQANGDPSLVHSASTVSGFEYQATPKDLFDAYYGGAYMQRNTAIDVTGQLVGYGYDGSPSNHNKSVQEFTFGYTRNLWRDPSYGGLQFMTQYSYVVRHPWSVAVDQPSGAHANMLYLNLRYLFPGAPPVLK